MHHSKKLEVITIGKELLLGLTPNRHLTYLGRRLSERGLELARNVVVDDDASAIENQFKESWKQADIVLTTGGLGPTSDDRTRESVAGALKLNLVHDPEAEAAIFARFKRMGKPMSANNLKQAYKPEGAQLLLNPNGTAAGIWLEHDGKLLVMLPGPSQELHPMFETHVLPRFEKLGYLSDEDSFVEIRTCGLGESAVEETLNPIFEKYPGLDVAFCASDGMVDCRLRSADGMISSRGLQDIAEQCQEVLGEDFVGFGSQSLSQILIEKLREKEQRLAVAESCTGGLLASGFTDIPGSSKVFSGGMVCYNNDTKVQMLGIPECLLNQHGAVSAETAVAMAAGAAERFSAAYALSITGFAGPGGGGANEDPVGTIFIGLHTPEGIWSHRCNHFGTRQEVKQRAVTCALDWLRRHVVKGAAVSA